MSRCPLCRRVIPRPCDCMQDAAIAACSLATVAMVHGDRRAAADMVEEAALLLAGGEHATVTVAALLGGKRPRRRRRRCPA